MSTRSTLWYSDDFHLYKEAFDDENVHLEVRGSPYLEPLILRIPLTAWKEMRQHTIQPMERYLDLSDEELVEEAKQKVDEHRKYLETLEDSRWKGIVGSFVYGPPESSREEMIDHFLQNYRPKLAKERE